MFKIYKGGEYFFQWDIGQRLIVEDETITEVHFCNRTGDCSYACEVYELDGLRVVNVPNVLLQSTANIRVYGCIEESAEVCFAKDVQIFRVISRGKPEDYVYTEEELKNYNTVEERINIRLEELEAEHELNGYYTPSVDAEGNLSWTGSKEAMPKAPTVNIKGEKGEDGTATDEQVSAWLEAHPEATTTVQKGSLTEDKFSDDLKKLTFKDYITPQMYGAFGDGVTDDTKAFQDCINESNGRKIVIPHGTYVLRDSIYLPDNIREFSICGEGGANLNYNPTTEGVSLICSKDLFVNQNENRYYTFVMRDIKVTFAYNDEKHIFFNNITLYYSNISNCHVNNASIFLYGNITTTTVISQCRILGISETFIDSQGEEDEYAALSNADSHIEHCYINGNSKKNPSVFKCQRFNNSFITHCYIDFFKCVIDKRGSSIFDGVVFDDCIFDIIWRFSVSRTNYDSYSPMRITNCTFFRFDSESMETYFTSPDNQMTFTNKDGERVWKKSGVIVTDITEEDRVSYIVPVIGNMQFTNCLFDTVDYPIYLNSEENNKITEKNSLFRNCKAEPYIRMYIASEYLNTFYFESLMWKEVDSLPICVATETSMGITGLFDKMIVIYGGKPIIAHNKKWYDFSGNEVTA